MVGEWLESSWRVVGEWLESSWRVVGERKGWGEGVEKKERGQGKKNER